MDIFLIRHAESASNVDHTVHGHTADHRIPLTPHGVYQAEVAGRAIASRLAWLSTHIATPIKTYVSPYLRTKQTMDGINRGMAACGIDPLYAMGPVREHVLLREIEYGMFDGIPEEEWPKVMPYQARCYQRHLAQEGSFYAHRPMGESVADVAARAHGFVQDVERAYRAGYAGVVAITHSQTIRCLRMQFTEESVEWVQNEPSPDNTSIHRYQFDGFEFADQGLLYDGKGTGI